VKTEQSQTVRIIPKQVSELTEISTIKLHTLMYLRGNIPTFIKITDGSAHDVNILDDILLEPGAFYIIDRGYIDFSRLYSLNQFLSFSLVRVKKNFKFRILYSYPIDKSTGWKCSKNSNLGSNFNLFTCSDHKKTIENK